MHDQVVTVRNFFDNEPPKKNPKKKIIKKKFIEPSLKVIKKKKKSIESSPSSIQKKWISDQKRKELEKVNNFIAYAPKDAHTEAALAVETKSTNFDAQARQISVDINADDDKGMYKEKRQKVWYVLL